MAAALLAARTGAAAAQDSVFGIRGLGFLGLPVSARSAGMGGGYALFDGAAVVSPASLAAWRGAAGWAVGAGSSRRFDPGTGATSLSSVRFPVFGFAAPVGSRIVVGFTASDYLSRNWDVVQSDTVTPRDSGVAVSDRTQSLGGVTDVRVAAAYRLTPTLSLGVGLHLLSGSAQVAVRRDFTSDTAYHSFVKTSETNYSGVGASFGVFLAPVSNVIVGASARVNGRLRAASPSDTARVHMPLELNGGVFYAPVEGITVAATAGHASWSAANADLVAAGQAGSRDVWSVGAGAEVALLKMGGNVWPVRAGYRWRQLPFLIGASPAGASALNEHAVSAGLSFSAAAGRANVDFAVEAGSRSAGTLSERFTTILLGVSILP